jgi:serine/threonine protein kinase
MDINNLTKNDFTDLVDKMLEIVHSDNNNNNNKINKLIKLFCNEPVYIKYNIKLDNSNDENNIRKLYKIYPCNEQSLIKEDISLVNIDTTNNKEGILSTVHKKIIPGKIFKKSKNSDITTLFSMLFDCLLYKYAKQPNYLCKVDEIGKYDYDNNLIIFYSIMDDCGYNLHDFFMKIKKTHIDNKELSPNEIKILFHNVLIIFYKMIEGVKILFDLGYAHLDVKPPNFVISCVDKGKGDIFLSILHDNFINLVSVRIIDFGTIRKLNHRITITEIIGSPAYAHKDLLGTISKKNPKNINNITIKHDIYSLGRSFAEIIMMLFTNIDKEEYFNDNLSTNNYLNKILNRLSNEEFLDKIKSYPTKILHNFYDNYLKNILKNMLDSKYFNINILMKELLTVIFVVSYENDENINKKIFLENYKKQIKDNEDNFTDTFKYYSSINQLYIPLNNDIAKNKYRELYKLYVTTYLNDKKNTNIVDSKLNEYLNKLIHRYLLKIHDVGYEISSNDNIKYFRITDNISDYISLKDYFYNIVQNIDMSDPVIQYKLLTRILYVFSLIMNCIQLIGLFDRYNLEVLLDNFIIKGNQNINNEDNIDIDIKITNGIQKNGLNTKSIEALGYLLFRVLYKCFGSINKSSFTNKLRKLVGKEKAKKEIENNNAKVVEINKNQKKINTILSVVKIKEIYLEDLANIIKRMINDNINIDDLISIFRKFRKTIYLNEILGKYIEISSYSKKIKELENHVTITLKNKSNEQNFIIVTKIFYRGDNKKYELKNNKIFTLIDTGNFSKIYNYNNKQSLSKNNSDNNDNILKITDKTEKELNGIVFEFLLYNYIEYFYQTKLKYLCKIHEIGTIKSKADKKEKYYSIIDKYGVNLNEFFKSIGNYYNIKFLYNILKIFYEMMECIEIIHDLGFLYLNIKPTNFLLLEKNLDFSNIDFIHIDTNINNVKITDFSNIRKIGSTTKEYIGDLDYIPSDWKKYQNQKTIFQKGFELKIHHDIFSLGCIFREILKKLCDNNLTTLKEKFFIVKDLSKNNDEKISKIIDKLMKIIKKMVEPYPEKRYQDIRSLMVEFGYLISDISKIVEEKNGKNPNVELIKPLNYGNYKVFYNEKSLPYILYQDKKYPIRKNYLLRLINKNKLFNKFGNKLFLNKNRNEYKSVNKNLENNKYISNTNLYLKTGKDIGKIPIKYIISNHLNEEKIKKIISGKIESNNNTSENEISINFILNSIFSKLVKIYCDDYINNNSSSNKYKDFYIEKFNKYRYSNNEELFILESIYLLLKDLQYNKILNDYKIKQLINNLSSINYSKYEDGLILIQIPYEKLKSGNNYFYSKDNDKTIFYLGKLIDIQKDFKLFLKAFTFKYNDRNIFGKTEISINEFKGLKLFEIKQNTNNKKNSSDKWSMFSSKLNSGMFSSMFGSKLENLISNARKLLNDKNSIISNYNGDKDEKNIGLVNCGNMCYAIAAIQFLYHNENIRNIILSYNINNININNIIKVGITQKDIIKYIEILKCIKYIFYLFENNNSNIAINLCENGIFALLHSLIFPRNRRYNLQEDTIEFLSDILNAIQELKINCGFKFRSATKYNAQNINGQGNIPEYTKVEDTYDNICILSLTKEKTIQSCIDYYLNNIETLNGLLKKENGNNTKFYNKKQSFIEQSEKYIFFQLKRFIFNSSVGSKKLNNPIEINYNITFRVGNYNKTYKINGVICHLGNSIISGHYTYNKFIMKNDVLYVKEFNDSYVTDKKYIDNVKNNIERTCYVLMYEEDETKRTLYVPNLVANPLGNSVANPLDNPVAKSSANLGTKSVANPASANLGTKPLANPLGNSVAKSVANPVANLGAKPVANPVANLGAKPVANPVANPVAKSIANSSAKSEKTKEQEINASNNSIQPKKTDKEKLKKEINNILENTGKYAKYTPNQNKKLFNRAKKILSNHSNKISHENKTQLEMFIHMLDNKELKRKQQLNKVREAKIKEFTGL